MKIVGLVFEEVLNLEIIQYIRNVKFISIYFEYNSRL